MKNIAIIGAGLSGLLLAHSLGSHAKVTVYEKARGVGGRCSTRISGPFVFDHGAQFFTARTPAFQAYLQPLIEHGVISHSTGKIINLSPTRSWERIWDEKHYTASPQMNSWCSWLARDSHVILNTEVAPINRDSKWQLHNKADSSLLGSYDWVILTAPPEQVRTLLAATNLCPPVLQHVSMKACHAVMLGFEEVIDLPWLGARVHDSPIKWITVNSNKPGRDPSKTCLVAHSHNDWAEQHIDTDPLWVEQHLLDELCKLLQLDKAKAGYAKLHRWKYAIVAHGLKSGPVVDMHNHLAITSDWAYSSRLEEVWQAATEVANQIKQALNIE